MTIVDFITELFCCVDDKLSHELYQTRPTMCHGNAMAFRAFVSNK